MVEVVEVVEVAEVVLEEEGGVVVASVEEVA